MKDESFSGSFLEDFKKRPYLVVVGLLGVVFLVLGLMGSGFSGNKGNQVEVVTVDEDSDNQDVYVDVSGAVENPGMYLIKARSRVNDALVKAGGLVEQADKDWVSQNLNLAQELKDGQKLYIPFKKEDGDQGEVLGETKGKVNINKASISQLDTLWGVGEATAKKIIEARPYSSKEELLSKKVVSEKVYEAIKDEISIY